MQYKCLDVTSYRFISRLIERSFVERMESPDELEEGPLSDLSENISKSLDDGKRQNIY